MSGERNLRSLLDGLDPVVRPGSFVFVSLDTGELPPAGVDVAASIAEPEGLTLVLEQQDADAHALGYDFVAGWVTLRVHSALDAVGLTAAVSAALTRAGISANVLAGFYHDHFLVPADRVEDAVAAIRALSAVERDLA
jgi:uncharacterized protein